MVINWTNPAVKDLKEFRDYTLKTNPSDYIFKLIETVDLLTSNPKSGKIFFYSNKHIVRQLIYKEHRIPYYIDNETIHIIAVIHHKQDIKRKIKYIKNYLK